MSLPASQPTRLIAWTSFCPGIGRWHQRSPLKQHEHARQVHHVTTLAKIAKDLGEDEDWLWDIANEMEIEDGVIWVHGVGEDGVQALTDSGIENLIELIRFYKENPGLLRR
ncbi:hypothetical protein GGD66_006954 [Bradyrhizobium sp. CIR48]|nr:hypothetical protein [Bradyrhizobium sp. CIR48]